MPNPTSRQTIQFTAFMSLAGVIVTSHGTPYAFSHKQITELADWLASHNPKFDRDRWLESIDAAIAQRSAHNV